ncbi:MAG: DUF4981 domain-containing protein [Lachnospiraceae bacterium]|nr:DUF4981 domain-containing protein [Lachnospiraceae bacterium]
MSFSANNYQQQSLIDKAGFLSERDRRNLEDSWAGYFAQNVFPRIDERRFAVLFSEKSPSPNAPINVLVAAMILEELFNLGDEEIVETAAYDVRFQTALHTTSSMEQPFSARSLVRLRGRCRSYEEEYGEENLLKTCIDDLAPQLNELTARYFPQSRLDADEIAARILRTGTGRRFHYEIVRNPEIFKENVLPAHSEHSTRGEQYGRISLNGLWRFSYAPNYESAVPGFEKMSCDCRKWGQIRVPAHMQMEGFGTPSYNNVAYPWEGREEIRPGQIPERFNPVGSYVKYFTLPESWKGRPVYISFQGVESGFALWLNGTYIGYSEDSFTPSEFDLTRFVKEGENKLAVQVFTWTSSSWMEDQDFYRFSGIYRDVYLFTTPDVHLYDLRVRALPDFAPEEEEETALQDRTGQPRASRTDGILNIAAKLRLPASLSQRVEVFWKLYRNPEHQNPIPAGDFGGRSRRSAIAEGALSVEHPDEITTEDDFLKLIGTAQIPDVQLWSAESPNLYDLELEIHLVDESGREDIPEQAAERVGFRRFEMKDGLMMLNGRRIVFNGTNRHDFSADRGRAITEEEIRKDIITMKRNNINAIRTSHYPNTEILYRLCDEYGLYLIAENNMETHGTWDMLEMGRGPKDLVVPGDRPEFLSMCLDRINSCYQRDKNHPAILIWSVGNESFGGKDIWEMSQLFRRLDPDRLVHYEGIFHDRTWPDTSDMESQMYPSAESIRKFLKEHPEKPFICCEYTHSMGNSNGGMHLYTELAEEEPRYQGGFIWDYIDQALRIGGNTAHGSSAAHRAALPGQNAPGSGQNVPAGGGASAADGVLAYGGDCGERPTDYEFSGNGIVDANRNPYPGKMQEVRYLYQPIGIRVMGDRAVIRNRNLFTDTSAYDCFVTLEREGEVLSRTGYPTDIAPLSEREILLPVPQVEEPGEYTVTVSFRLKHDTLWAQAGYEIAYGQGSFVIENPAFIRAAGLSDSAAAQAPAEASVKDTAAGRMKVIHSQHIIGVIGENFEVQFSGLQGGLTSYRWGGKEMIEVMPRMNFWRAPTNNDDGNRMAARHGQWKLASLYQKFMPPEIGALGQEELMDLMGWPRIKERRDLVEISWKYFLPTTPAATAIVTYRITPDGSVRFILDCTPPAGLAPMPEFGMLFTLAADYNRIRFYGNGPEETYCDRDKGAKLGVYTTSAAENLTHYLVPQECGNRTGVRWASVTDNRGRGLLFCADGVTPGEKALNPSAGGAYNGAAYGSPGASFVKRGVKGMNFSALPYSPEELENARHYYELSPVTHTIVRCSLQQMGVGGDDSWGAKTLPQYLLPAGVPMHFEFTMRGI